MTSHVDSSVQALIQRALSFIDRAKWWTKGSGKTLAEADAQTELGAEAGRGDAEGGWKFLGVGAVALVLAGGLTGCTSTEDKNTSPSTAASPSPSATLTERQQAIAAAELALRDYEEASIEASRTLQADNLQLMNLVTPTWWSEETVPELNRNYDLNRVLTGNTTLASVQPIKLELRKSTQSIKFRVCKDVTDIQYVKAEGKNKGKVVYDPDEEGTTRFEMTYTFVYSKELNRWRLASYLVPLDEHGESTPC
jgi:hypothetical protein